MFCYYFTGRETDYNKDDKWVDDIVYSLFLYFDDRKLSNGYLNE